MQAQGKTMPTSNENVRRRKTSNASFENVSDVNSDTGCKKTITRSECASQQQLPPARGITINKMALVGHGAESRLNTCNFSFERVPSNEAWFKAFSRQDKCEENVMEYYQKYYYHQLPFELGPLKPKAANCSLCPKKKFASKSTSAKIKSKKLAASNYSKTDFRIQTHWPTSRSEKNSLVNLEISRRSPREHASTLAIMSCLLQGDEGEYDRDIAFNFELKNKQIYANNCLHYDDHHASNGQSNLSYKCQVQETTGMLRPQILDKNMCEDSLRKMEKDIDFQLLNTFKELDSLDNAITLTNQLQHCLFTHDFCLDSNSTAKSLICETKRRGPGRPPKRTRFPKKQDSIFGQFIENSIKNGSYNRKTSTEVKTNFVSRKVTSKLSSKCSDNSLNAAIKVEKRIHQNPIASIKYNTRNKSRAHKTTSAAAKVKAPTKIKRNISRFKRIKFKNLDVIQTKGKRKSIPDAGASTSRMATRGLRKSLGYLYKKR